MELDGSRLPPFPRFNVRSSMALGPRLILPPGLPLASLSPDVRNWFVVQLRTGVDVPAPVSWWSRSARVYRYHYLPEYYDLSAPYDRSSGWGRRGYRDGSGRRGYRSYYFVPRLYERLERRRLNW